jgi:Tat protein translocase TatB subunit
MFNIGGGELIVILLIALIVLGPQRLPNAARQLGKAMGDLRRLSTGFQTEMKQALETADDPNRVTARRHVLASEPVPLADEAVAAAIADDGAPDGEAADAAAASIAAVTAQPSAPPNDTPPASEARASAPTPAADAVPEDPEPRTTT